MTERREPQEGFDWAEYEAYLEGGVEGVRMFEYTKVNAELSMFADGSLALYGQVESALILQVGSIYFPIGGEITEIFMIL